MGNFIPNTSTTLELSEIQQIRTRTDYLENEIIKLKKSNIDLIDKNNSLKKELELHSSSSKNNFTLFYASLFSLFYFFYYILLDDFS